jgi:tetratricopeptide (TPR) repeat protein
VAKVYHALAQGYLAELNGKFSHALEFYEALISDETPVEILEDSLKRILVISLNRKNIENSLLALDCLSAISPIYQPKYAEMLRMTGNLDQAIAVYSDYLPKVPGDLNAMVKLGKVYLQAGQVEAARLAAKNVLSKDGENREGLALLNEIDKIFSC